MRSNGRLTYTQCIYCVSTMLLVLFTTQPHAHILGLEVFFDTIPPSLSTYSALLDPSEGCDAVADDALVDADHPRFKGVSQSPRPC